MVRWDGRASGFRVGGREGGVAQPFFSRMALQDVRVFFFFFVAERAAGSWGDGERALVTWP